MSFSFEWPRFSDQFHADAMQMLSSALNKGNKPPVIADTIEVVELEMGTQPPELEIRDVGELTLDQFRGIFRLTYSGDAHIVLRTKVQANPLNHKQPDIHLVSGSRGMLAAKKPLVVPMLLRLSHFKLNSYVVLVVSKQKGITIVFKTDPLQNVDINSTFDSIAVIQKFIQREIEGQLRQMFREDLPSIIHRLSQQWVKAKVEAPYLGNLKRSTVPRSLNVETASAPDTSRRYASSIGPAPPMFRSQTASVVGPSRPQPRSTLSVASVGLRPRSVVTSPSVPERAQTPPDGPTSFPDLEHYDPTYGLRPEGLPTKSVFTGFSSLFVPNRGLADLTEEPDEHDVDDETYSSFDAGTWDDLLSEAPYSVPPPSVDDLDDIPEYETVPAIGGGTVVRPRVIHSQSRIDVGEGSQVASTSASRRASTPRYPSSVQSSTPIPSYRPPFSEPSTSRAGSQYNPYFAGATPLYTPSISNTLDDHDEHHHHHPRTMGHVPPHFLPPVPPLIHSPPRRGGSPVSVRTQPSRSSHSIQTPPDADSDTESGIRINQPRRSSFNSFHSMDRFHTGSPPDHFPERDPKIVLKPAINNSVSRLTTLSHSNHTLSPYTYTLEHFAVRSGPPRDSHSSGSGSGGAGGGERQPVKARRKRIHRLGGGTPKVQVPPPKETDFSSALEDDFSEPPSPSAVAAPISEFDASEWDRYFRSQDNLVSHYPPELHPAHSRRRLPSHS